MELKTKLHAEPDKQEITISREFDLPVELLFKAYSEPELIEQWMNTKVVKHQGSQHGYWQFETSDQAGNVVFKANGTYHRFETNSRIVRTFEIENAPFGVQLEFLEFESLSETRSKLNMQIIYRSLAIRDQMLQLPFAAGLNGAHNRLQEILNNHINRL